jgi:methylmalonyl-CoA mutase
MRFCRVRINRGILIASRTHRLIAGRKNAMAENPDDLALAAEFPPATREQWLKLVDGVLKGAPFEKKLVAKTYDGLAIEPLYARAAAADVVPARAPGAFWRVSQRVDHPDPAAANAEALDDLAGGATGLSLVFAGSIGAYGYGLEASETAIACALDDVHLEAGIAIELDLGGDRKAASDALAAVVRHRNLAPAETNIRFGFDPIGEAAALGQSTLPLDQLGAHLTETVSGLAAQGFKGPFAVADGRIVHNAGGSEAQELGYALAVGVAYLRALEHGFPLDVARRLIFFRLAADADQILTIAKFRALRKLWARVECACGLAPEPILVSAETAWRMMTRRDPWVNMLRATVAVFSAGLGGADTVCVVPHTTALGLPDRFARRMARNAQLILLEESNLARVADPAAGSGAMEDLTQRLCAAAWALFQDIERAGGVGSALEQGLIQRNVAATRAQRQSAIARREDALTGTSEFPNLTEAPVSVLDVAPILTAHSGRSAVALEAMPCIRLAEPFERLRDASDRILAETGARPKVFLANLGTLADFGARAMFARNFFEVGGIHAITNDGFADDAAMIAAFKASGAAIACLCSSDKVYARVAVTAAKALSDAGARHICLAGRPTELEAALTTSGVGAYIHVGCDVLATLHAAYQLEAMKR